MDYLSPEEDLCQTPTVQRKRLVRRAKMLLSIEHRNAKGSAPTLPKFHVQANIADIRSLILVAL